MWNLFFNTDAMIVVGSVVGILALFALATWVGSKAKDDDD